MFPTSTLVFRPAVLLLACLFFIPAFAQTPPTAKIIAHFAGTNGANPASQLIQLPNGNLLGLTLTAAYYPKIPSTIYQILHTGAIQTVYTLAADGSEGAINGGQFTNNGLVQASDGNIYGLTYSGKREAGAGLVFRFTFPNTFEVLHNFYADPGDCGGAVGSLVEAADGYLYGVGSQGGTNGAGAIFRVGLDGSYAKVYDFVGSDNIGGLPFYGLVAHPNGLLYGITDEATPGHGSIFQFDPISETAAFVAPAPTYGAYQSAPLVGLDGGIYLVSPPSPPCGGCTGTLVRYGTDGSGPETLFTFPAGTYPGNGLVEASSGLFLNTSSPALLVNTNTNDSSQIPLPAHLYSNLLGNITETAGAAFVGTFPQTIPSPFFGAIIEIEGGFSKPLPSITGVFPALVPPGQTVTVLGNYFVGTTGVTVAGQSVAFSVKASGAITFHAPQGPLSGVVSVTTPAGKATSQSIVAVN